MTSKIRRVIGVSICLSPVVLLGASIAASFGANRAPFSAVAIAVMALAIGALNFYLSFIRIRWIHRRRGSLDGVASVSGFPMVGTLLALASGVLGFGSIGTAGIALIAVMIDTGGAPWFLVATWRDKSLWDGL